MRIDWWPFSCTDSEDVRLDVQECKVVSVDDDGYVTEVGSAIPGADVYLSIVASDIYSINMLSRYYYFLFKDGQWAGLVLSINGLRLGSYNNSYSARLHRMGPSDQMAVKHCIACTMSSFE